MKPYRVFRLVLVGSIHRRRYSASVVGRPCRRRAPGLLREPFWCPCITQEPIVDPGGSCAVWRRCLRHSRFASVRLYSLSWFGSEACLLWGLTTKRRLRHVFLWSDDEDQTGILDMGKTHCICIWYLHFVFAFERKRPTRLKGLFSRTYKET